MTAWRRRFVWLLLGFLGFIIQQNVQGISITKSPGSVTGIKGANVTMECSFSNQPDIVTWYFNTGVRFQPILRCDVNDCSRKNTNFQIFEEVGGTPQGQLHFTGLRERNNGAYRCEGYFQVESAQSEGLLIVQVPPSTPRITPSSTPVQENSTYLLTCSVWGANPKPKISWFKQISGNYQKVPETPIESVGSSFGWFNSTVNLLALRTDNKANVQCRVQHPLLNTTSNSYQLNIHYKPVITPIQDVKVILGSSLTMKCTADGNPTPYVYFTKSGQRISDKSFKESAYSTTSITSSLHGTVLCQAENSVSTTTSNFTVSVLSKSKVSVSSTTIGREGSSLEVTCVISGNPTPNKVTWRQLQSGRSYNGAELTFNSLGQKDSGPWRCTAESILVPTSGNTQTVQESADTEIIVEYIPGQPSVTISKSRVLEGDQVTLLCRTNSKLPGIPAPSFHWKKDSITNIGQMLVLNNVTVQQSGNYQCTPRNSVGQGLSAMANLNVEMPPKWKEIDGSTETVSVPIDRSDFKLLCSVKSKPEASIKWYKNGKSVTQNEYTTQDSIKFQNNEYFLVKSELKFEGKSKTVLSPEDTASYECDAKNEHGKVSKKFNVVVIFKPKITSNETKQALGITKRADIRCDFMARPMAVVNWYFNNKLLVKGTVMTDSSVPYKHYSVLSGVQELGTYTCVASNTQGSNQRNFLLVNQSTPEQPHNLKVLLYGWDHVQLSWQPGFSGGLPPQYWVLIHRYEDGKEKDLLTQKASFKDFANVTNLLPNTNYTMKVYGINSLGSGKKSTLVSVVTKSLALPRPTRVYFGQDGSLKADTIGGYCMKIEQSKDREASWSLYHFCVPSETGKLAGVSLSALYKISLCLTYRTQVCGESVTLSSTLSLADIPASTLIIVGCCCAVVIFGLIGILVFFCCRRPHLFKNVSPIERRQQELKSTYEQHNTLSSPLKPLAMVSPSFSSDNVRNSFCDIKDYEDGNEVFATYRSANLTLPYSHSHTSFRDQFDQFSNNNHQNRSMQALYPLDKHNSRKVVYEVVV